MKTLLVCVLLTGFLFSCSKEEVEPKQIVSISPCLNNKDIVGEYAVALCLLSSNPKTFGYKCPYQEDNGPCSRLITTCTPFGSKSPFNRDEVVPDKSGIGNIELTTDLLIKYYDEFMTLYNQGITIHPDSIMLGLIGN